MRYIISCLLLCISLTCFPQDVQKPRLIVGIMIDGFQKEHIEEMWTYLDANGIKSIIDEGTTFQNMRYNITPAGIASDIATIMTGTTPNFHGITGNHFFNRKTKKTESILEDNNQRGIGTTLNYSAHKLIASTFTDEIQLAYPGSRTFSVAIEPQASIMMGGHTARSIAWIDDVFFKWISTGYYAEGLPSPADAMNVQGVISEMADKKWQAVYPLNSYLWNFEGKRSFNYTPSDKLKEGFAHTILRNTPVSNTLVTDLAVKIIEEEKLGSANIPDVLMLQYTVRTPNEQFGAVKTPEKEDMYLRLDKDIKNLLETIKKEVGLKKTLIILFSNKSGNHTPIELGNNKIPSGYFNANRSIALLNTYLMAIYGQEKWVDGYYGKNIFLNREKIEEKKLDINEIRQLVADFMMEFEGIRVSYTANQIQNMALSNDIEVNNIRNSYHKNSGGDVVISLLPGWLEVNNNNFPVGEISTQNFNIPFYMYGWEIPKQKINTPYYITDIAPTISGILNIPAPNACIGKPMEEIIK